LGGLGFAQEADADAVAVRPAKFSIRQTTARTP
jgi:hypothetical protein